MLSYKLLTWQQALNTAVVTAQANVNNDARLTPQNKSKMLVELNNAYLSMVSGPTSRISRALIKLRKINSIPDNMTPETMMKIAQQYQEDSKAVKQTLGQFVGNLSSQQLSGLVTVAKDFQLGAIKNEAGAFQQA